MKPMVHSTLVEHDTAPYMVNSQLKIFHPGRDGDNHGGNTEEGVYVFAPAPTVKKWCSQTMNDRTVIQTVAYTRGVTKQTFTRDGLRRDLRTHRRQAEPECTLPRPQAPNQVDVHHHVATHVIREEMGARAAVRGQQRW